MKLDMEVTKVTEGRKTYLKLLTADKQVKEISKIATAMYNELSTNYFSVSKNGIKVYPSKDGFINENALHFLNQNFDTIVKYARKFRWNNQVDFESDALPKAKMIVWLMKNWTPCWSQSPYGESFYSSKNIGWGYKPEGSLRVSDHWNFGEDGEHCHTAEPVEGWAVCRFENGVYHLVQKF